MKKIRGLAITSAAIFTAVLLATSLSAISTSASKSAKNYWTPEKIKGAKSFEMIFDKNLGIGKRIVTTDQQSKTPVVPGVVTGLAWTEGGIPQVSNGKVFFSIGNSDYTCSGSLVDESDTTRAIVLTAGHCAYEQLAPNNGYVQNWIFIPQFESVGFVGSSCEEVNGCWSADALTVDSAFKNEPDFTDTATAHDWAFATIKRSSGGDLPDDEITGLYPLKVGDEGFTLPDWKVSYSFGYPAAGKFKGKILYYCKGDIAEDSRNQNQTWGMRCDMTGGSSGGPWVSRYTTADQQGLSSVNSYKYINDRKRMYGPKFNVTTQETMNSALSK